MDNDKCFICDFPLKVNRKGPNFAKSDLGHTNFYIRYEYKFLKNINAKEELESSDELKTLKNCYKVFDKFLKILITLKSFLTFDCRKRVINRLNFYCQTVSLLRIELK